MDEAEFDRRRRDARIVADWLDGATGRDLATRYGLSPARVRAIVNAKPGLAEERALRRQQRQADTDAELRSRLHAWSTTHPGAPASEAAQLFGVPVATVRDLLAERELLHRQRGVRRSPRWSDQDLIGIVARHVADTGDHSAARYQQIAATKGWPSIATLTNRLGGWRQALHLAGHPISPLQPHPPRNTDDDLRGWVARYLEQATQPTWTDLEQWMRTNHGPSRSLIRRRLGPWHTIIH